MFSNFYPEQNIVRYQYEIEAKLCPIFEKKRGIATESSFHLSNNPPSPLSPSVTVEHFPQRLPAADCFQRRHWPLDVLAFGHFYKLAVASLTKFWAKKPAEYRFEDRIIEEDLLQTF